MSSEKHENEQLDDRELHPDCPRNKASETDEDGRNGIISEVICGIKEAAEDVEACIGPGDFEVTRNDFCEAKKMPISKVKTKMTVYAPKIFLKLRRFWGFDTQSYLTSWLHSHNNSIKTGAGRSGALFFKSDDKKFIFKTIFNDETREFKKILPHYYQHMFQNPNSLLMKMVGLYRLKNFHHTIHVLIFVNVLFSPNQLYMDEVYDLKGREAKPGKEFRNQVKTGIVLKDNDLNRKFHLGPGNKEKVIKLLEKDVELLSSSNIMDYSLLVGVHKIREKDFAHLPNVNEERSYTNYPSSYSFGNEVLFIGIIDCLTFYGTKKIVAHMLKRVIWTSV